MCADINDRTRKREGKEILLFLVFLWKNLFFFRGAVEKGHMEKHVWTQHDI